MDIINKNHIIKKNIIKDILKSENTDLAFSPTIFCFNTKEDIKQAKGHCFPNIGSFFKNNFKIKYSHFTPNLYKSGWINENHKLFGHSENNLHQINCFVIDVDSKIVDFKKIISVCKNINLIPNLILNTPNGYHLYFILNKPVFKNDFKTAKNISKEIRFLLGKNINNIDMGCNHFGIFRYPSTENILYKNHDFYSFDDLNKRLFSNKTPSEPVLLQKTDYNNTQINTKWFKLLYNIKNTPDKDYMQGRNNVLFTLALACYSSKLSYEDTLKKLSKFNENLKNPLTHDEYIKTITSAYSSKYKGAEKSHIKRLVSAYVGESMCNQSLFYQKHKKARKDRLHSYIFEWEKDFITWITKKQKNKKYIKTTNKAISKNTGIPESSLKILITRLKNKNTLKTVTKKGRNGYTIVSFTPLFYKYLLSKKEKKNIDFNIWKKAIRNYLKKPSNILVNNIYRNKEIYNNTLKKEEISSG